MKKLILIVERIDNGYLLTIEQTSLKQESPSKRSFKALGQLWEYVYQDVGNIEFD